MTVERTARADDECLRCGGHLTNHGVERLRIGGTSGGWKMVFGELAELGEQMLALELHSCDRCRMVEFRTANG